MNLRSLAFPRAHIRAAAAVLCLSSAPFITACGASRAQEPATAPEPAPPAAESGAAASKSAPAPAALDEAEAAPPAGAPMPSSARSEGTGDPNDIAAVDR